MLAVRKLLRERQEVQVTATRKDTDIRGLHCYVARGAAKGTLLRPDEKGGFHTVSFTRFARDELKILCDVPLEPYLQQGYHLRMSAPGRRPSLISPASIKGRDR